MREQEEWHRAVRPRDAAVTEAAKGALDRYGTSASASRMVAGEHPVQRELERALADFYDVEDCVAFVSSHATNVTVIGAMVRSRRSDRARCARAQQH